MNRILLGIWTKPHPSTTLLQKCAHLYKSDLMYRRSPRFQAFLRIIYRQFFVQTRVFGQLLLILFLMLFFYHGAQAGSLKVGFLVGLSGIGDQSYNDMTYAGLIKAKQEMGIDLILEDMEKSDEAAKAALLRLIDSGADIIVSNGFNFQNLIKKYAALHKDLYFIIHDAFVEGQPNVVSTQFAVDEGSFLAGVLAGMMSQTHKIGFIGGVDIPIMHVFRNGFRNGIHHISPESLLIAEFVSKAPDFSGFNLPAKGFEMAMAQYSRGADIIYSAAGLTGNGVLQAARKADKFAIGVDSDQDHLAKGHVLTSMMKRLDIATYAEVANIYNKKFKPGVRRYGLRENGVGLSPMKYSRHFIPDSIIKVLAQTKKDIISGKISVSVSPSANGKKDQ